MTSIITWLASNKK